MIGRCTSSNLDKFKGDFRTNFNEASPWCKIEDKVCIVNRAATTLDANFPLAQPSATVIQNRAVGYF